MATIKKTLFILTVCITSIISTSCTSDPLDLYEDKLDFMIESMLTYGYTLDVIQTYEDITTAEKKIDMRIDQDKEMMYLYMYESVIGLFNEDNHTYEKTYFYELNTIYEDVSDVMTSRAGTMNELIEMTSLNVLKTLFSEIKRYDIHNDGLTLYLLDLREIELEISNERITKVVIIKHLELTTITQTFYPFYENGEVFIPKYKLEGTTA
jgi:hypothetical protein